MWEINPGKVNITDAFWSPRQATNAQVAIHHQWDQLERVGTIHNFRLAAGRVGGIRQGWFFVDSDAYKWLDAACRIYSLQRSDPLRERIESFVTLIGAAQEEDGYLYTYNQFHFPGDRWRNLQIEHELYCHGHLIEAAVSHYEATGQERLLRIACRAADLLVQTFLDAAPEGTPGHQEIELALIKLYRVTGQEDYLALAEHFLEQRGRIRAFGPLIFGQNMSVNRRAEVAERRRAASSDAQAGRETFRRGAKTESRKPRGITTRFLANAVTGKYFQQHRPVREQTVPVGHAVRFAYLQTALAMLSRERGDESYLPALELAWDHMVSKRMYVTGGIGSLPVIEGFGRDFELDPEIAYAESCAALGCIFWNWEMGLITKAAKYADLLEWQLYNAAGVGLGLDGRSYFYSNPLTSRGEVMRQPWFDVACCPSNLSRTWAHLGRYLYSCEAGALWIHQYVGSQAEVDLVPPMRVDLDSALPWQGQVTIRLEPSAPVSLTLCLRVPSWAGGYRLAINGEPLASPAQAASRKAIEPTASGYDPRAAYYLPLRRTWSPGDLVELDLPMPVAVRQPHPSVKSQRGKVALSRGPLVYCLESVDNPGIEVLATRLDLESLQAIDPAVSGSSLSQPVPGADDAWLLRGQTQAGQIATAIPYALWGNRGRSQMTVMVGT